MSHLRSTTHTTSSFHRGDVFHGDPSQFYTHDAAKTPSTVKVGERPPLRLRAPTHKASATRLPPPRLPMGGRREVGHCCAMLPSGPLQNWVSNCVTANPPRQRHSTETHHQGVPTGACSSDAGKAQAPTLYLNQGMAHYYL